ncbi:PfkB family carbohydrate kinase [Roseomonas populi]|uniref:PfkB family carbohydrate kinase n=1 Tax=Roseomonas populi TaxID=3121582 RepID=A0ABT1XCX1_9PROT|nr:PfkB family carbohydrate kinase [Roseomonas pecuniae]MCR0985569.1 PfkB family carbohydrate kinase [Roseomonas pecuniae]
MASVACIGMTVHDRILSVPSLPTQATKLYATAVAEAGGGPAATASVAIAALGGSARLFGRVGADDTGRVIRAELARYGVDVAGIAELQEAQSAWSAVAVDAAGERLILNFPGRNLQVPPDWIDPARVAGCGAVLVDMGWPLGGAHALDIARRHGIPSVLDADLGPLPEAAALIGLAGHVVFSESALRHHSGEMEPGTGLHALQRRLPGVVLGVTTGPEGYLWLDGGALHRLRPPEVAVVDTLGAGDVFHGAYALGLAEGMTLAEAARFAVAAATLKCTRAGGRAGVPSRPEVEAFLAQPW